MINLLINLILKLEDQSHQKELPLIEKYDCLKFYYIAINCLNESNDQKSQLNCEVIVERYIGIHTENW